MNQWFEDFKTVNTSLALGGGGARGCYEIGAVEAFNEMGIFFDSASGTSIGALVGAMYVQHTSLVDFVLSMQPQRIAENLFDFPTTLSGLLENRKEIESFLNEYILSGTGMDISPLKEAIDHLFNWEKFKNSPVNYACMTFNVTWRRPEAYFKDEMTEADAKDIILASASCYPAFPMLVMNGEQYMDGGYWDNVPIDLSVKMHADKVLAIDVEGPGLKQPIDPRVDLMLIKPILSLGNFLDFSSANGIACMKAGYLEMFKLMGYLEGTWMTFDHGSRHFMEVVDSYLRFQFEVHGFSWKGEDCEKLLRSFCGYSVSDLSITLSRRHPFCCLCEALGKVMEMDPYKIHRFSTYNEELLEKLNAIELEPSLVSELSDFSSLKDAGSTVILKRLHDDLKTQNPSAERLIQLLHLLDARLLILAWTWVFLEALYE